MICNNCNREIGDAAVCPYCNVRKLKEPQPHHLAAGTIIDGRYKIEGVLGEGGFGITYLGYYKKLGNAIAVKEYFPHGYSYRNTTVNNELFVSSSDAQQVYDHGKERFLSEAKTLAKFTEEPGIVSVIDFIEENNTAYLIMEYLNGVTLQQYLKLYGTLAADEAFTMLEPMIRTLEKIHNAGIIHRDISPDNIMRLTNGQLKLMDFGAARDYLDDNRSMSVMLKKGYAPMEQYRRNGEQGPWTDVYALCATIYRCITGKAPVDALDRVMEDTLQKPSEMGVAISPELEKILMYGLEVRKRDRCQSMTELLQLIEEAKNGGTLNNPVTAPTAGAAQVSPADEGMTVGADEAFSAPAAAPVTAAPVTGKPLTVTPVTGTPVTAAPVTQNTVKPKKQKPVKTKPVSPAPVQPQEVPKKKNGKLIGIIAGAAALVVVAVLVVIFVIKPGGSKGGSSMSVKQDDVVISAGGSHIVGLKSDGTVVAAGVNSSGQCSVGAWTDIEAVSAGGKHTLGLTKSGTVVAAGDDSYQQCTVDKWTDITAVSAGKEHSVGLTKSGTVVAKGKNDRGQCKVDLWKNITAISAGSHHTVGVQGDGKAVACGDNSSGQCNVGTWSDIVTVSAGGSHTVGLKKDGTVVATGDNSSGQCDVKTWTDIAAISAGEDYTIGLKKDGTVVATGVNTYGKSDVKGWSDIVSVSAADSFTLGLKKDGTVVVAGKFSNDVSSWKMN